MMQIPSEQRRVFEMARTGDAQGAVTAVYQVVHAMNVGRIVKDEGMRDPDGDIRAFVARIHTRIDNHCPNIMAVGTGWEGDLFLQSRHYGGRVKIRLSFQLVRGSGTPFADAGFRDVWYDLETLEEVVEETILVSQAMLPGGDMALPVPRVYSLPVSSPPPPVHTKLYLGVGVFAVVAILLMVFQVPLAICAALLLVGELAVIFGWRSTEDR